MSTTLHPYLNFAGRTEEAMRFYEAALGGNLEIMRMGDSPIPCATEHKNRVMHATLIAGTIRVMASDSPPDSPAPGGNGGIHLSLNFTDTAEQDRVWAALLDGGTATMPLADQFFGRFGMLVDRFGIPWMLHYAPPPSEG